MSWSLSEVFSFSVHEFIWHSSDPPTIWFVLVKPSSYTLPTRTLHSSKPLQNISIHSNHWSFFSHARYGSFLSFSAYSTWYFHIIFRHFISIILSFLHCWWLIPRVSLLTSPWAPPLLHTTPTFFTPERTFLILHITHCLLCTKSLQTLIHY